MVVSYKTLTNMGYEFELYHSIEYDAKACVVALAHSIGFVQHPQPQDLLAHPTKMKVTYTDILATTECGPWGRASGPVPPRGFNDPRAKLFLKACDIINDQLSRNRHLNVLFENVDIHPALAATDGPKQEELLGFKFHVVNVVGLGSLSSRPRRIASNMANPAQLKHRSPPPASFALGDGVLPIKHPMYCLISKRESLRDTWNRQQCWDQSLSRNPTEQLRDLNGDERDVYMGHVRGDTKYMVDTDGTRSITSENYRRELLGKGIHEIHVEAYFEHRNNAVHTVSRVMLTRLQNASPEKVELFLSDMTHAERKRWFSENTLLGYKKLQLKLNMDLSSGLPQTIVNYGQGGKLDASMDYALKQLVEEGIILKVPWSKDYMISPCFPKLKPHRTFPGTDIPSSEWPSET